MKDELLLWEGRWYIPNDMYLKNIILHGNYDSMIAGHLGIYKTIERFKHNHYLYRMEEDVMDYFRACNTYEPANRSCHRRYSQLELLQVPYRPRSSISMKLIVDLLRFKGYTHIQVIFFFFFFIVKQPAFTFMYGGPPPVGRHLRTMRSRRRRSTGPTHAQGKEQRKRKQDQ